MGVGLRLKRILRERKMTIKQLSEVTGIPLNTLYSITKRDSERVAEWNVQAIADALNIYPADLLDPNSFLDKEPEYRSWFTFFSEKDTDMIAFDQFLTALGFRIQTDPVTHNEKEMWIITELRNDKSYYVSSDDLLSLMNSVLSYSKFQILELIKVAEKCDA